MHSDSEDKFLEGYLGRRPFDDAIDGWVCMCVCVYIHVYMYMCVCVCVCNMCVCVYIYIYMYVCIYIYIYIYVYAYVIFKHASTQSFCCMFVYKILAEIHVYICECEDIINTFMYHVKI